MALPWWQHHKHCLGYHHYITRKHSVNTKKILSLWSCQFVCYFVCVQDYYKSNQPISLKLGAMIGPAHRKNWLTFGDDPVPDVGDDPVPDTDSRSFFHFRHHCRIGDFRRSVSISHTITGQFSWHSANWLMMTRLWTTTFWEWSSRHPDPTSD